MPFTWDDLQFFLAVAKTGQLSAAARHLGSSHATVSRRIDRLEFALKVKLFERNSRGYVLTVIGQRFIETAERMQAETERLQADLSTGPHTPSGIVRLSAPEGFANFFFTGKLSEFRTSNPGIALELLTIQQIMSLSRKEADVAVGVETPKAGPYFSEKICDYSLHLYGSKTYLGMAPQIFSREDLLEHPFIGYIDDMIFAPGLDYLGEVHRAIRARFQSSSIFAQLTATRNGLGLCILPHFIADQYSDLAVVLPAELQLIRTYWLICHNDFRDLARVKHVTNFIKSSVGASCECFIRHNRTKGDDFTPCV